MGGKSEFQDILNGFLEGKHASSSKPPRPTPHTEGLDPAHLAFLLGTVRVSQRVRPSTKASRPSEEKPFHSPPRPRTPAHALDEAQQKSLGWFAENGELLEGNFTAAELKKAFRRLALRFHPDRPGGTAHRFQVLRQHESTLRRALPAP